MFPARSDFTSGAAGAAWYTIKDGDTTILYQTQWPTLVRKLQSFLVEAIDTPIFAFGADGTCGSGSTLSELASIFRVNARRKDALTVDGNWGPETADGLGWLLCKTGQRGMAQLLAQSIAQKGNLPGDVVRETILFAQFVGKSQLAATGQVAALPEHTALLGGTITLPPDTVLPRWNTNPTEGTADQGWIGQSEWGNPLPNPPSIGGERPFPGTATPGMPQVVPGTTPPPETAAGPSPDTLALIATATLWLANQGAKAPRATRKRVARAIRRAGRTHKRKRKASAKRKAPKKNTHAKKTPAKKATKTASKAPKKTGARKVRKSTKKAAVPHTDLSKYTAKEKSARAYGMDVARRKRPLEKENLKAHEFNKHEQAVARYWYEKSKEKAA